MIRIRIFKIGRIPQIGSSGAAQMIFSACFLGYIDLKCALVCPALVSNKSLKINPACFLGISDMQSNAKLTPHWAVRQPKSVNNNDLHKQSQTNRTAHTDRHNGTTNSSHQCGINQSFETAGTNEFGASDGCSCDSKKCQHCSPFEPSSNTQARFQTPM